MIRLKLKFYPNQANPARASGRGVYRVAHCYLVDKTELPRFAVFDNDGGLCLYMTADRMYKRGSRVDPLKIALAVMRGPS